MPICKCIASETKLNAVSYLLISFEIAFYKSHFRATVPDSMACVPQRWLLCLLIFSGLITNYMLRVNMSIAIVQMVKKDDGKQQSICVNATSDEGGGDGDNGEGTKGLAWSGAEVSWVLSSFFIGYVIFQVPGGRLAEFAGSKRVFGWTMAGVALLAAATPLIAQHVGVWLVIAVRLVQVGANFREACVPFFCLCGRHLWHHHHLPDVWLDHRRTWVGSSLLHHRWNHCALGDHMAGVGF